MIHSKPKLSIIILAYNEKKYLASCLDAIKEQIVTPDEVVVVNNNSSDKTVEIAESYPFVRVIHEPTQGMIPARNAGFNTAKGDLLARIDADTRIPPDWSKKVHVILDNQVQAICGVSGPQYFYALRNPVLRRLVSNITSLYGFFGISRLLLGHETLFGSNMVITRSAWNKVKNEVCHDSQKVHEDIDLAIHIGTYGQIIFNKQLEVGVSARPLREGIKKNVWRLTTWVKTISQHRKLFTGNSTP
jgi:glycosyltransferase involved in cell wall biosynthesis